MNFFSKHIKGDRGIWVIVILLSCISILAVYSSTGSLAFRYQHGNTEYYLLKHFFIIVSGLFILYLFHKIKYTYYSRFAQLLFYISIPLLLITLISGTNINEASRWLTIPGIGISFQSSDIAKLGLILYVARLLAIKQSEISDLNKGFIPLIIPIAIITILIFPANLSTAILVFGTCIVLMYVGRTPVKYILATAGIVIFILVIGFFILKQMPGGGRTSTWVSRIENFKSGDEQGDYQAMQAKIAIANGGVFGKMPGNSTQRNFLPHPYSDFIYALIVEEFGFIGGIVVLMFYLILLYRGIRIAARAPGAFGAFLAIGLTFLIVFQALINMGVAVGLLPVTGQPLPLVSMGGTSIWFTCIAVGIILSVSRSNEYIEEKENENTKN